MSRDAPSHCELEPPQCLALPHSECPKWVGLWWRVGGGGQCTQTLGLFLASSSHLSSPWKPTHPGQLSCPPLPSIPSQSGGLGLWGDTGPSNPPSLCAYRGAWIQPCRDEDLSGGRALSAWRAPQGRKATLPSPRKSLLQGIHIYSMVLPTQQPDPWEQTLDPRHRAHQPLWHQLREHLPGPQGVGKQGRSRAPCREGAAYVCGKPRVGCGGLGAV